MFVPDKKKNDVLLKDKPTPTVVHLPKDHARKTQSDLQKCHRTEPLPVPIVSVLLSQQASTWPKKAIKTI